MTDSFCRQTLQEHTVAQLRKWAQTLHIATPGYVRKNDLILKILHATTGVGGKRSRTNDDGGADVTTATQPALKRPRIRVVTTPEKKIKAAIKIQRFFRRHVRGCVNHEDFLNLEPFSKGPLFRHVVDVNQVYRFYPLDLWRYFQENGLLRNPYTHADFNNIELRRLQKLLKQMDPTFCRDLIAEKEELRRVALEAMNLEHNVQYFHESLRETIIGSLQACMNDGTAFDMTTDDLLVFVDLWSMQEATVNNHLYTLLHLSRSSATALIYDLVTLRFVARSNSDYTLQFRLYVDLVISTVENVFLYFLALPPQNQPFLLAHNIWNTVIQETLRQFPPAAAAPPQPFYDLDQPQPVNIGDMPIPQQPPLIRQGPLLVDVVVEDYDSDDEDSEDEDEDEEEDEVVPPPPPPPVV